MKKFIKIKLFYYIEMKFKNFLFKKCRRTKTKDLKIKY